MALGSNNPEQNPYEAVIGAVIMMVGIGGEYSAIQGQKTYIRSIAPELGMVNALNAQFETEADNIAAGVNTKLAVQADKVSNQIGAGMTARGINSPAAQDYAKTAYAGSISGAYAAAHAALQGAKVNASNALDRTISTYYQNVAQNQLQSVLAKEKLKAGLYGMLIGAGGQGLAAGVSEAFSANKQPDQPQNEPLTPVTPYTSEDTKTIEARKQFFNGPQPESNRLSPDFTNSPLMDYNRGGR
jgi:hypothetical protein